MTKRRIHFLALLCAACLLFAGCTGAAGQERLTYTDTAVEEAVRGAVLAGQQTVRLNFAGQVAQADVTRALNSAYETSGLVVYAVRSIAQQLAPGLGRTGVTLTLTYREDLPFAPAQLPRADTRQQLAQALVAQIEAGAERLAVTVTDPTWTQADLLDLCETATGNAQLCCEAESFDVWFYPEQGPERVASITLHYSETAGRRAALQARLSQALDEAQAALAPAAPQGEQVAYRAVYDYVLEAASYDFALYEAGQTGESGADTSVARSAYGALVGRQTVCTGYAAAYAALCRRLELPCWVVTGQAGGEKHVWNAVCLAGETLYVDCTFADTSGDAGRYFLMRPESAAYAAYTPDEGQFLPWEE